MAQKIIDVGTTGNDGTGDTIRLAGIKINDNFTELYDFDSVKSVGVTAGASTPEFIIRQVCQRLEEF